MDFLYFYALCIMRLALLLLPYLRCIARAGSFFILFLFALFGPSFSPLAADSPPPPPMPDLDTVLKSPAVSPQGNAQQGSSFPTQASPPGFAPNAFPSPTVNPNPATAPLPDSSLVNVPSTPVSNDFAGIYGKNAKVVYKTPPAPVLEGKLDGWYILSEKGKDGRGRCYAVSYPFDSIGNHKSQRKPFLMVVVTRKRLSVFVATGFEFAPGSRVFISVDGRQFSFVSNGYLAVAEDVTSEFEFVKAMMPAAKVMVYARSVIGSYSVDSYSLNHFPKAYKKIIDICAE